MSVGVCTVASSFLEKKHADREQIAWKTDRGFFRDFQQLWPGLVLWRLERNSKRRQERHKEEEERGWSGITSRDFHI